MSEIAAKMAMFSSAGLFTTSTPFHQQHDSGIERTPLTRNLSQTSAIEDLESNYFPLRKNLFGKRKNISENAPDHNFSHKHKLLLSKCSTFSRRDVSSNKETPRAPRSYASSDAVQFATAEKPKQPTCLFLNKTNAPLKQLADDDSGFFGETPERSRGPTSESHEVPFLQMIENILQRKENPREESLAYFKHSLNVSGAKSYADLSTSEILHLYHVYRFQRMGLKPSAAEIDFCEKNQLVNGMNEKSESFILSWKDRLECISASLEEQPKIDFLSQLHKMNLHFIIHNILWYLHGHDLQSARCVSQMWRKLVCEDKNANAIRLHYLEQRQKIRKDREKKKLANPFQRPPNFRILGNIENVQQKEQLQLKKTIKEINFDAFIEVGKSGHKYKPMKCPSCGCLSLQDKQVITKCNCLFCGYEFCCNCLKPYSNWHFCATAHQPTTKPPVNSKKYLRRL